jgi:HK97 gp10 family phage protein
MAIDTHVKGLAELNKFLQELPVKVERNILRGALRAGMNQVKPVAERNAAKSTGLLAAGLKVGTRARGRIVMATVKATGPHAYLAKWIEFGTKAHNIAAKKGGFLSFMNVFVKSVAHPGTKPHPFMRPALDQQANAAVFAAADYMRNRLATKHGIDTAGIVLEGDE